VRRRRRLRQHDLDPTIGHAGLRFPYAPQDSNVGPMDHENVARRWALELTGTTRLTRDGEFLGVGEFQILSRITNSCRPH
jgi:hypothetical protein